MHVFSDTDRTLRRLRVRARADEDSIEQGESEKGGAIDTSSTKDGIDTAEVRADPSTVLRMRRDGGEEVGVYGGCEEPRARRLLWAMWGGPEEGLVREKEVTNLLKEKRSVIESMEQIENDYYLERRRLLDSLAGCVGHVVYWAGSRLPSAGTAGL